jgi:hypothetical protein
MIRVTSSDVHKKSLGLNASDQLCIFSTDEVTVIANLEKPTQVSAVVALTDADATPTASQICDSKIFTIPASAARNFTLPIATLIVAAVAGYAVGMEWDVTIVNTGAGVVTVVGDTGTTIVGLATIAANTSATFRVFMASSTAVVFYRK